MPRKGVFELNYDLALHTIVETGGIYPFATLELMNVPFDKVSCTPNSK